MPSMKLNGSETNILGKIDYRGGLLTFGKIKSGGLISIGLNSAGFFRLDGYGISSIEDMFKCDFYNNMMFGARADVWLTK